MAKHVVARVADIPDGGRLLLDVAGRSIGVFNIRGRFYALLNRCPHQGAQLCRGSVLGRLEAHAPGVISYDPSRYLLQCPWHGWEYDLETGQSFFDSLVRPYPVGVEHGESVAGELARGEAVEGAPSAQAGEGRSAPLLHMGPFVAETFPISIEEDYIVLSLPGPSPGEAARRRAQQAPPELDVIVSAVTGEADDVVCLDLALAAGGSLPDWEPGDHIDLLLAPGMERQYSLCGDPRERHRWRVAVLRAADSRGGSSWVHERVTPGTRLRVRGPRHAFPLVDAGSYVFVAGGIGITPLLPMIERLAVSGADWTLLYGGRRRSSMAFCERLASFEDRVTLWPQDERGLLDLDALIAGVPPGAALYCCGPEPLIGALEERCATLPAGTLHVERFRPRPGALEGERTEFEVVLARAGVSVTVAAEQSILDAVQAVGVEVPRSCREGICGTCETAVLEGEPDHHDSFLSDDERASGATMMVCCSRARSERLVLDL
jgi:ferredoxin-NADP reductase/nitrite reductase/ring-hydroxylating ferredoxin subunit